MLNTTNTIITVMKKLLFNSLRRFKESLAAKAVGEEFPPQKELIRKFDKWVESKGYFQSEQTMQDVADSLGVSHAELSWVCRRVYGDNFLSLRKRLRLSDACRMLVEDPEMPLSVIGECVGIPDRTNFRRQFYAEFGMSPQEWRDKHGH